MTGPVSLLWRAAIWPLQLFCTCFLSVWTWVRVHLLRPAKCSFLQLTDEVLQVVYTPLLSIWTWVGVHLPWPATLWFSQQPYEREDLVSHRLCETQELKGQVRAWLEELPPLRKIQKSFGAKQGKDFCLQVRISGKTGGWEKMFLKDVSGLLSCQGVSLQVKEFAETSKDLLLLFCPIASRMGTDIENALEGLGGEQEVLLVVMHLIPKDNLGAFVDTKQRVPHPAVVLTVHTRFTLHDGFYPCEMNEAAVADVADAIKDYVKDQ